MTPLVVALALHLQVNAEFNTGGNSVGLQLTSDRTPFYLGLSVQRPYGTTDLQPMVSLGVNWTPF